MARRSPQTLAKRQREASKRDKRRAKDERRLARKAAKDAGKLPTNGDSADAGPESVTTSDQAPSAPAVE